MITEDFLLLRKVKIRLLSRGQKLLYTYGVRVREREPMHASHNQSHTKQLERLGILFVSDFSCGRVFIAGGRTGETAVFKGKRSVLIAGAEAFS